MKVEKLGKNVAVETDCPCVYTIWKSERERGGVGGGYPSVAAYLRKIFHVSLKL